MGKVVSSLGALVCGRTLFEVAEVSARSSVELLPFNSPSRTHHRPWGPRSVLVRVRAASVE
jgi:hypothetical protein